MKQNLAKLVTKESVIAALNKIKKDNLKLEPSTKYDLEYEGDYYPPKEVVREAARIQGIVINDDIHSLGGGDKTNIPLRNLGFVVISKNRAPEINKSILQHQINRYSKAIYNTGWITNKEIYKFNFIKWLENNINFEDDAILIKQGIELVQQQKFDPNTNIKGINFLQTIKIYNDDYITIEDIDSLKEIAANQKVYDRSTKLSFKSFPKTSLFLSFFKPDEYLPYDGESLPSYGYFTEDDVSPPKKGYIAFQFYQKFYQSIREELKKSNLNITFFKNLFKTKVLTNLHWNWITQDFLLYTAKETMMSKTIQERYNDFEQNEVVENWPWYINLKRYTEAITEIKSKLSKYTSYQDLNDDFKKIVKNDSEDFLERYLFISDNGFSTIRQQLITWERRGSLSQEVNANPSKLFDILRCTDKVQCYKLIHEFIDENRYTVIYRFLRALFPDDFTSVDAPVHFRGLCKKLKIDYDYSFEGNQMSRNEKIMQSITYNDKYKAQIFFWIYKKDEDIYNGGDEISNDEGESNYSDELNQIFYGAPGTGKTYITKKAAVEIIDDVIYDDRDKVLERYDALIISGQIVFTTFHQSISYEDFIEGIKPETVDNKVLYEVKDGIFKQIAKAASQEVFKTSKKKDIETKEALFDETWGLLIQYIEQKLKEQEKVLFSTITKKNFEFLELTNQGNLVLKPEDEDSLEYSVSFKRVKKLYEVFSTLDNIQNIDKEFRNVIGGMNASAYWSVLNWLKNNTPEDKSFLFNEDKIKKYVIIIDEINRGNVSSVFGELITLIEEDKRKGIIKERKETIEVKLPYSNDKFSVPDNLYIIGTMNTADRSVEALDTALRRRFSFIEMQSDSSKLQENNKSKLLVEDKEIDMIRLLDVINDRIEILIDKDHQIGHSFFINIEGFDDLVKAFKNKVLPLLEEYFFGDYGKIGLVLGDKFIKVKKYNNRGKFANFTYGEGDDISVFTDKVVYEFTSPEEWLAETFISIYE
ncbi:AAA family ATPase [Flavobacterium rakeshii]|uniref:McrB family protein n=1 Tax=Flavobacterium rakeshii TaxID=1038845 RepID=UPI002E7AC092|nr:AAA family ATPase [Flavobacterium rakeshii]MEE1897979.1 AAA family ATPase [Flavobacterium rakeshii]